MPIVKCLTFTAQLLIGGETVWNNPGLRTQGQAEKFLKPKLFDAFGMPLKSEKGAVVGRVVPAVLDCEEDEARRRNYAPAPASGQIPEASEFIAKVDAKEQKIAKPAPVKAEVAEAVPAPAEAPVQDIVKLKSAPTNKK